MALFQRIFRIVRSQVGEGHGDPAETESEFRRKSEPDAEEKNRRTEDQPTENLPLAEYFANLELPYGSDLATVTAAWKRLLKKYHPDLHSGDPEKQRIANELVQGLNKAYGEIKRKYARGEI
ncbi:MAG TPA: hypothetical protein ENK14_05965 [Caldithrix sp.]|nr:hypothetical protein [Caldithrix sp.]